MSPEERSSIENGIWLCANCASLIDRDVARYSPVVLRDWKEVQEANQREIVGQSATDFPGFDAEIECVGGLLRDGKHGRVVDRLSLFRDRHWDRLSPRQRYRTLANLGLAHLGEGLEAKAAAFFQEAAIHQPDDPDAQSFLARSLALRGETEDAYRLSAELVRSRSCRRAAAVYVRTAPAEQPTSQLVDDTALWHDDGELLKELATRAINRREFDLAERLATRLAETHPTHPDGSWLVGKAIYARIGASLHVTATTAPGALASAELDRAEGALTDAHALAVQTGSSDIAADALLTRYHIRSLLARNEEARRDLEEAGRLAPSNAEVLITRAVEARRQDPAFAVQLLRDAASLDGGDRARMFLALLLKDDPSSADEALTIFLAIGEGESEFARDALANGFSVALAAGQAASQERALRAARALDTFLYLTMKAEQALTLGDNGSAAGYAREADAERRKQATEASTRRRFAELLVRLGEDAVAFDVCETLAVPGFPSPDLWNLLTAAHRLGRHRVVLDHCRAIREAGRWDQDYVLLEASLLEDYDPQAAYELLTEYLERHPTDPEAVLRWAIVSLRLGVQNGAGVSLSRLPAPDAEVGAAIATTHLLHAAGRHDEAFAYAYDLLRAHWAEPDAHVLFFQLFLETEPEAHPHPSKEATAGAAVCYREPGRESRWLVIEDSATIYPTLGEVAPASPLAGRFLGKRPGDRVLIADGVQPREAEILRVAHKYAYRWQQCAENYQTSFPERQDIQAFRVDTEGDVERTLAPLLRSADLRAERVEELLAAYRNRQISAHFFGERLGLDPIRATLSLALDNATPVMACPKSLALKRRAVAAARSAENLILTPAAIGTILALEIEDEIAQWGWRLQVTHSTRDVAHAFVRQCRSRRARERFGRTLHGYAFERIDPDAQAELAARTERILELCEPVPALALAALPKGTRDTCRDLQGASGAETLAVTQEGPSTAAWSDDHALHVLAASYGARVIGVQAVLEVAVERKHLSPSRANTLTAQLLGMKYETVWFSKAVLKAAAAISEYDPSVRPLSSILDLCTEEERPDHQVIALALFLLYEVVNNLPLEVSRNAAVCGILERIAERTDGDALMERIRWGLPLYFGVNVLRADEVLGTMAQWLRGREG